MISRDIKIDDLIREHFDAVGFLIKHGLPCVVCGEPFWGTLEELARQNGYSKLFARVPESVAADFGSSGYEIEARAAARLGCQRW